jgi:hypothetical protein
MSQQNSSARPDFAPVPLTIQADGGAPLGGDGSAGLAQGPSGSGEADGR